MSIIQLPVAFDPKATLMAIERRKCELSLAEFIKAAWHVIEPGQPYIHGWHIDFICAHLEAITRGETKPDGTPYNRLLINVPPGTMKSLITNVFWPAWEWGPCNMPHLRYVCTAHSRDLAIRDGIKMRRLVQSEWYRSHWSNFEMAGDQNSKTKFENSATGFRQAAAFEGLTGARGDRVIVDDPHSVDGANSDQMRQTTLTTFTEAIPTRLNNPTTSAIVVIMQRLHEEDVSGYIIDHDMGYDHIMLPMRYESARAYPTMLGYEDPREEEGELLFEERFPLEVVERDEAAMGPYAAAGQFQQAPVPRGGGIIKDHWWQLWDAPSYPQIEYVVASLDTAFTAKTENDASAMTIWGIFRGTSGASQATRFVDRYGNEMSSTTMSSGSSIDAVPKLMLMFAWNKRLEFHELVEEVANTCRRFQVDKILIEAKASGLSVAQELRRVHANDGFFVQMYDPGTIDKVARLYSVQHLFAEGAVFAPDRDWAELVIRQVSTFPKGKHDDMVDTVSMALQHMRSIGLLTRAPERLRQIEEDTRHRGAPPEPIYET